MKRSRSEYEAEAIKEKVGKKKKNAHWNFKADYNDHFETPLQAYQDLLPVLRTLSTHLYNGSEDSLMKLNVFDPYFCLGSMKEMLQTLGIPKVINRNRDFYKDIINKDIPGHTKSLHFIGFFGLS